MEELHPFIIKSGLYVTSANYSLSIGMIHSELKVSSFSF